MTDRRAQVFQEQYAFQTSLIHNHIEHVTDIESLLQLPFEANCMNWIVGHILARRHSAIDALGEGPFWDEDKLARYRSGSDPIVSTEQALTFKKLRAELDRSMTFLEASLSTAPGSTLDRIVKNDRGEKSAADHIDGFLWHETYHIGQLDILRAFIRSERD
jgi:hypothetical protein